MKQPDSNEMPPEVFRRYVEDPLAMDELVRQWMRIPEDRYYTVSVWPVGGRVTVDLTRSRVVRSGKISKSNQTP